jgi:hypothetical protein
MAQLSGRKELLKLAAGLHAQCYTRKMKCFFEFMREGPRRLGRRGNHTEPREHEFQNGDLVSAYRAGGFILILTASDDGSEGMRAGENLLE